MTGSRLFQIASLLLVSGSLAFAQRANSPAAQVMLTPANVQAGSPELIRVTAPEATAVDGEWMGYGIQFFRGADGRAWFALAGVDVEAPTGPSTLSITIHDASGAHRVTREIEIGPAHYRTTRLTVAPRFTEPSPKQIERIKAESALKSRIFSTSAAEPLWHGDFRVPVRSAPTDSFGTRRVFNGEVKSVHNGMDFRARSGTPVRASNSGVVVLARRLFFEGNCVVIDHGLGLYTISMHLSRIRVHEGERVKTGQLLGLSGATGRATGPHLHWSVRWHGAHLDPAKLLRMNLSDVH
jgi:murein DD-endopeptidase MepM/ murein hydrolase activator NlpD